MILRFYNWLFLKLLTKLFIEIKEDAYEIKSFKKLIYVTSFNAIYVDFYQGEITPLERYEDLLKKSSSNKKMVYSDPLFRELRRRKTKEYIKLLKSLESR